MQGRIQLEASAHANLDESLWLENDPLVRLFPQLFTLFVCSLAMFCQQMTVVGAEGTGDQTTVQTKGKSQDTQAIESFNARAKVLSITDDGALCTVSLLDNLHKSKGRFELEQPILISGVPADLVDGDSWRGDIFYAGIYKYSAIGGALKTVRAFATTEELALQRLKIWKKQNQGPPAFTIDETKPHIDPPFGLEWGERDTRLKQLIAGARANIVNTRMEGDEEIWEVTGLIQTGLMKTLFVFRKNGLVAVDLYYESRDWNYAKYDDFLSQVQRRIEIKFGNGVFISPYTGDVIDNNCVIWGYSWKLGVTAIDELEQWSSPTQGNQETVTVRYQYLER
jgi:hypothetical protein